jgi:hypothetical protein
MPLCAGTSERAQIPAEAGPTMLGLPPTTNVLGVYFPAWLVSTVTGLVISYTLVNWLGGRSSSRALGQSGVFFCSLTVTSALIVWWIVFSDF